MLFSYKKNRRLKNRTCSIYKTVLTISCIDKDVDFVLQFRAKLDLSLNKTKHEIRKVIFHFFKFQFKGLLIRWLFRYRLFVVFRLFSLYKLVVFSCYFNLPHVCM